MTRITNYLKYKKQQKILAEEQRREEYLKDKGILLSGEGVTNLLKAAHLYDNVMNSGKKLVNNNPFNQMADKLDENSREAFYSIIKREEQRVFLEIKNPVDGGLDYKTISIEGSNLPINNHDYYVATTGRVGAYEQIKPQIVVKNADPKEVEIVKVAMMERVESDTIKDAQIEPVGK